VVGWGTAKQHTGKDGKQNAGQKQKSCNGQEHNTAPILHLFTAEIAETGKKTARTLKNIKISAPSAISAVKYVFNQCTKTQSA